MTNSCKKEHWLIIPNQGTILSEYWHCWFDQSMTAAVYHALGSPLTSVSFQLLVDVGKLNRCFFPCSSLPVGFSLVSCCLYGFTYLRIKLKKVAGYCWKSQTENTLGQLLCQSFWKSLKGSHMEKRKCASKKPHTLLSVWRICLQLWFVAGIVRLSEVTLLFSSHAKQKWHWGFCVYHYVKVQHG